MYAADYARFFFNEYSVYKTTHKDQHLFIL